MANRKASSLSAIYGYYESVIDNLSTSDPQNGLSCAIHNFVNSMGFDYFVYAGFFPTKSVRENKQIILNGYPTEWREHYDHNGYSSVDPVVCYSSRNVEPFNWSDLGCMPRFRSDATVAQAVMDEARQFGLACGWTMPLHGVGGAWSLFSISMPSHDPFFADEHDPRLSLIYLSLAAIHTSISERQLKDQGWNNAINSITEREREVVAWAAEGKTTWETSLILGIAQTTVRFHLNNVSRKLDSTNKANTVSKAILYGVL